MKRLFAMFVILVATCFIAYPQSQTLLNEIEYTKNEAVAEGFTLLDQGGFMTNYDDWLRFELDAFFDGYIYLVVVFLEGCSECAIGVAFQDAENDEFGYYEPDIKRAGNIVRGIYSAEQERYVNGKLYVYSKTPSDVYTYGMLFRKPQ